MRIFKKSKTSFKIILSIIYVLTIILALIHFVSADPYSRAAGHSDFENIKEVFNGGQAFDESIMLLVIAHGVKI